MDFGIAGVAAITVIAYLVGLAVKATALPNRWIPVICAAVARSAAKGLCDYFGIVFREPRPPLSAPLYRVQVGAFRDADNARAFLATVRAAGFGEAFITTVNP
jgi:hypothetical protein